MKILFKILKVDQYGKAAFNSALGFISNQNKAVDPISGSGAVGHVMPKSMADNKDVKAHHLLVLLLRLRQVSSYILRILVRSF